jgi:hypothetical protein
MSAEVPFRFDIAFVYAAPCCSQKEIGHVAGIGALPLRNLGSSLVLFGSANKRWAERGQLLEDVLFEARTDVGSGSEVGLSSGVAAFAAHVDEISERLSPGSALMKIGALPAEGIRRDYALRLELIITYGATELDLTQRCHNYSSRHLSPEMEKEYLCHDSEIVVEEIGLVEKLGRLYLLASQNRDRLPTRDLVVDAHQPTA